MKIWVQNGEHCEFLLKAIRGGVKQGVYLNNDFLTMENLGQLVAILEEQGITPIIGVESPIAMKKEFEGLALVWREPMLAKKNSDLNTFSFEIDTLRTADKAIEGFLEFLKRHKVPLVVSAA